jgi:signal transduction histidine kinase
MADNEGTTGGKVPRIVLIDDDPGHLQVVQIIMMREDFPCDLVLFQDPREGLAYLEQNPANLAVMDIAMPHLDGFEMLSRLRAEPRTRELPVIFLSAYKETEYVLRAFEMGAADYLTKPIISPVLAARIRAILHTQDLQGQLRQRNQDLEHINRLKDEMLSICSHDLRSPLSAIDLICQFLKEALEGRSKQSKTELVNRIVNQSRLARRLVENLLDLNRIEEGMLVPVPSFFKARDLVTACAEDEMPMLQARRVALRMELPPENTVCFGDREMIAQVVRNVLGNAGKFARETITVDCRFGPAQGEEAGTLSIAITDDGPGIPIEELPLLFGKYRKLETSSVGSGLGLYISRKIVELHGGKITAESVAGQGSSFSFTLGNAFATEDLPNLEEHGETPLLVLSASKASALLLEGILIEAGSLQVGREPKRLGGDDAMTLPDLAIVDALNPDLQALEEIAAACRTTGKPCRWIAYGPLSAVEPLKEKIGPPLARLEPPLNPVAYLNLVKAALEPARNTGPLQGRDKIAGATRG